MKLPAASGGESSICKEKDIWIRSLTPRQAAGNALAVRFSTDPGVDPGIGFHLLRAKPFGKSGSEAKNLFKYLIILDI